MEKKISNTLATLLALVGAAVVISVSACSSHNRSLKKEAAAVSAADVTETTSTEENTSEQTTEEVTSETTSEEETSSEEEQPIEIETQVVAPQMSEGRYRVSDAIAELASYSVPTKIENICIEGIVDNGQDYYAEYWDFDLVQAYTTNIHNNKYHENGIAVKPGKWIGASSWLKVVIKADLEMVDGVPTMSNITSFRNVNSYTNTY